MLSLLFVFLFLILPAYAEDEVSLTDFPQQIATKLDVSLFAGQLIASGIVLMLFILPTLLMTKNQLAPLITGIVSMGITIALGWMPVYLLAILTLLIALMFSNKISKTMS